MTPSRFERAEHPSPHGPEVMPHAAAPLIDKFVMPSFPRLRTIRDLLRRKTGLVSMPPEIHSDSDAVRSPLRHPGLSLLAWLIPAAVLVAGLAAFSVRNESNEVAAGLPSTRTADVAAAGGEFQELLRHASAGNAEAMNELGRAYAAGRGVAVDMREGVAWFRRAAERGHARAMFNLAGHYAEGIGVPKNPTEADRWYRKALPALRREAERGDPRAMTALANMYGRGDSVQQDHDEAARWCRRAAEAGSPQAMVMLGRLYHADDGVGLEKDDRQAVAWFRRAAEKGEPEAYFLLGVSYQAGWGVAADPREALRWYQKGADAGDADSMSALGAMYLDGNGGLAKNADEGLKLLYKAADQKNIKAMYLLALVYESGNGVKADKAAARNWYAKAAELGSVPARQALKRLESADQGAAVLARRDRAVSWDGIVAAGHLDQLVIRTDTRRADGRFIGVAADNDGETIGVVAMGTTSGDLDQVAITLRFRDISDKVSTYRLLQAGLVRRAVAWSSDDGKDFGRVIAKFLKDGEQIGPEEQNGWTMTVSGVKGSGYLDTKAHLGTPVVVMLEKKP